MLKVLNFSKCLGCQKMLLTVVKSKAQCLQTLRNFTVQDASTALRPFFFIVHPDLFGQHPTERSVNENSLKLLNEYLAGHAKYEKSQQKDILFFVRSQNDSGQVMKQVRISLTTGNLRDTVMGILGACGLSDSHVPQSKISYGSDRPIDWHPSYYAATGKPNPKVQKVDNRPTALTLRGWLRLNIGKSRAQEESVRYIQNDIKRLLDKLQKDIGMHTIRFDSVWGFHHFRGSLKSFDRLNIAHPGFLKHVLKGRILIFSNNTGVSRHGEIVLSSEDVPQTWITLLQTVGAYETVLSRLPMMEAKLSSLLNNIQVVRREKQHFRVMAEEYELLLNKILNSLRRCQDHVVSSFGNRNLSDLHLVVEGESSPLMLSSLGQFLVPASIPGTLVVDFINKNSDEALNILKDIQGFLQDEERTKEKAMEVLGLLDLQKDESVTPAQMISCCTRFAQEHWRFGVSLAKSRIRVSHYYSVMQDGQICVPWDWIGDED
ncbi:unnamed protein product [Lymnaea stagnalis]|uniref:T-cell activation inhibitor, mitochondrial n=1 Tax=Lymnaea stagnalis TaxID=6523 RepID=A0AAV2HVN1_LYMST